MTKQEYHGAIQRYFGTVTGKEYLYYIIEELISRNLESMTTGKAEKIKIHRRGRKLETETKNCNGYELFLFQMKYVLLDFNELTSLPDGCPFIKGSSTITIKI